MMCVLVEVCFSGLCVCARARASGVETRCRVTAQARRTPSTLTHLSTCVWAPQSRSAHLPLPASCVALRENETPPLSSNVRMRYGCLGNYVRLCFVAVTDVDIWCVL